MIRCKAWDAITNPAYYDAIGDTHELICAGGRVAWTFAEPSRTGRTVKVQRFKPPALKVITAYLCPDRDIILREIGR